MSEQSRLELVIDSKGVVTASGNLDIFKKKADEAAKAASGVESANRKTGKSFDVLNELTNIQTLAMGAANLAIVGFMDSCAKTAGRMEMLQTNLRVVTGSATEADKIFRELQKFAAETPFSVEGITDTAIQLMQVGVSAKDLQDQLRMLGDVSGGSQEKLNRIMTNYTQILSVGKASTMDIRQFAQANLPIYQELENVTGKTGQALQDMITNGEISGEVITEAFKRMTEEGGKFFNGMSLAADTWEGKKSTMEDSISNLATKFSNLWLLDFQKNAFDAITAVSNKAAEFFDKVKFGKDAYDTVYGSYDSSTFDQREYVANQQIKYWSKRSQLLKRAGGDYQSDPEYQDAIKQLNDWYDYLDKITHQEATLTKQQRESEDAATKAAEASKNAAKEAMKWQEILQKALSLDELPKTGVQAVSDFQINLQDSLHGAIAYAQMTGGSVIAVYKDYADKVRKAMNEIMVSGQFATTDNAVTGLNDLQRSMSVGFGISNVSLFDDKLFDTSGAEKNIQRLGGLLDDLNEKINTARQNGDWSEYFKNYSIQAGVNNIQGTDAGNFVQGFSQGGWQNGLINMVVGGFLKNLEDVESFQRALNLVTEALKPAADIIGDVTDALSPLMDAAVMGVEFGKELAEITLIMKPFISAIKVLSEAIYMASKIIMWGMDDLRKGFKWFANFITFGLYDDFNDFADSLGNATDAADEQAEATQKLVDELINIRKQIKEDQLYYISQLQTLNASSVVSSYSSAKVNDAIIAPGGRIITTAPDDYLYAAKDPGKFGGSGRMQVNVSINNTVSDSVTASVATRENIDGTKELMIQITKKVANDIATGELDNALAYRESRLAGRRVSV